MMDNLFLYNYIHYNYSNEILPKIPHLLIAYLLKNPDKENYYIKPKIKLKYLLKELSVIYKQNNDLNLLEEIINIMEE